VDKMQVEQSVSPIWLAKFPGSGLILGSSQFSILPQLAASKNDAQFKSGQN